VHLTLGILPQSQAVSHALAFFWLDGFAVPAPAQVTQTVGQVLGENLPCQIYLCFNSVLNFGKQEKELALSSKLLSHYYLAGERDGTKRR
jgi:hypothetical protein